MEFGYLLGQAFLGQAFLGQAILGQAILGPRRFGRFVGRMNSAGPPSALRGDILFGDKNFWIRGLYRCETVIFHTQFFPRCGDILSTS